MQPATQGEKEVASVRRILLLVTVAAVMAALMLVTSSAFAQGSGGGPSEHPPLKSEICQKSDNNAFAGSKFAPDDQRGGPFGGSCAT